jgi:hypothetical protein
MWGPQHFALSISALLGCLSASAAPKDCSRSTDDLLSAVQAAAKAAPSPGDFEAIRQTIRADVQGLAPRLDVDKAVGRGADEKKVADLVGAIEDKQQSWLRRLFKNSCIVNGSAPGGTPNKAYARIVQRGYAISLAISLIAQNGGYLSSTNPDQEYPFDLTASLIFGSLMKAEIGCRNEDPRFKADALALGQAIEKKSFWDRYKSYLKWLPITGGIYVGCIATEDFVRGGLAELNGDPNGLAWNKAGDKSIEYLKEFGAGALWDMFFLGVHAKFLDDFFLSKSAARGWWRTVPNMSDKTNQLIERAFLSGRWAGLSNKEIFLIPVKELGGESVSTGWRFLNAYLRKWGYMEYRTLVTQ